jgi:hypothetical protein
MRGERRGDAGRIGMALLLLVVSTLLAGEAIELLLPRLPSERLGVFGEEEVARIVGAFRITWVLAHLGAAAFFLAGTRSRRESTSIASRTSLATALFALALRLPLESMELSNAFARSRFLLVTYLALVAIALALVFHRSTVPPRGGGRRPSRHRSTAGLLGRLALGALALVLLAESVIDLALLRILAPGPHSAAAATLTELVVLVAVNSSLVAALVGFAFLLSRRPLFSIVLTGSVYALFGGCDVVKLVHLHVPLFPGDLFELRDSWDSIRILLSPARIGMLVSAVVLPLLLLRWLHRREFPAGGRATRWGVGLLALLLALGVGYAAFSEAGERGGEEDAQRTSFSRGLLFDLAARTFEARVKSLPEGEG